MKQFAILIPVILCVACGVEQIEQADQATDGVRESGALFEEQLSAKLKPSDCGEQSSNFTACFIADVCHEKLISGWREYYPDRIYDYHGVGHIQYPPHDAWIGEGAYRYTYSLFAEAHRKLEEYDAYEDNGQFDLLEELLIETASGFKITPIKKTVISMGRKTDAVTKMHVQSEFQSFSIKFSVSDASCLP